MNNGLRIFHDKFTALYHASRHTPHHGVYIFFLHPLPSWKTKRHETTVNTLGCGDWHHWWALTIPTRCHILKETDR